jgi:Protein of unknown function (DUF1579)/BNR/Asp-box repeat
VSRVPAGVLASLVLGTAVAAAPPDGAHDFDFNVGTWRTQIRRMADPFAGNSATIELEGTVTVRPLWEGRGQLEEIEAEGPAGHWEGLTLFLYDPAAHEWRQSFIGSSSGELSPAQVGGFRNGQGALYSQDTVAGRSILVRAAWSGISANAHHFEDAYSDDGGTSWHPAFSATLTRLAPGAPHSEAPPLTAAGADGQHDFDFDIGTWTTRTSRLLHPLSGSTQWVQLEGVTTVTPVWGGRANLAEFKADGPAGPLQLMSLRWFSPAARQWHLGFATPAVGALGIPADGVFRNGRGDFYDQEMIDGRTTLVRFSIWGITRDTAQSEQAFSRDGGKTWEVNWINRYTRRK